jgi:DNA invertase Pin-like site-specific DNA recombinase
MQTIDIRNALVDRVSAPTTQIYRAAQYVRMSTDHQQYSTQNQADKIADYAVQHNIDIVRTYADEGKSGLSMSGRVALQKLIADVEADEVDFTIILVYDVSRWGRFQDADESAYYEYICRRAGIAVTYCAEQFVNDGSPVSTIVKGVKRAMAGEYSRELSTKVFIGQCRLIEMGFRQGGTAGFGLRRMMIDQHGEFKGELKNGEQKSINTHRVILVPGPDEEVQIVNDMYRWLIRDNLLLNDIAERLNDMLVLPKNGTLWTYDKVRDILSNEKYIGNNVYNRSSRKLKTPRVPNPPEMWIRKEGAFQGIVPKEVFLTAQNILNARIIPYTDEHLLEKLRQLLKKTGWLTGNLIDETDDMPRTRAYTARYGSLKQAYELVGYWKPSDLDNLEVNRRVRRMYPDIIGRIEATLSQRGATVWRDPKTDLLHINEEMVICLVLARCYTALTGFRRWHIRFDPIKFAPDITLVIRLNETNQAELDYFLLPKLDLPEKNVNIFGHQECTLDCFRFGNLDFFYGMASRISVLRQPRITTNVN